MTRRLPQTLAALTASTVLLATASCGHKTHPPSAKPVQRSSWQLPATAGAPSVTNFCTLYAAETDHLHALGNHPNTQTTVQTLYDLAAQANDIANQAPPQIAPAAKIYFSDMALTYRVMVDAQTHQPGPNYNDLRKAIAGQDPNIANQITAYTQAHCHFDPNTAPPAPPTSP